MFKAQFSTWKGLFKKIQTACSFRHHSVLLFCSILIEQKLLEVLLTFTKLVNQIFFSQVFGWTFSNQVSIRHFLLAEDYNNKKGQWFPPVEILILWECQKVLIVLTFIDIQIHVSWTLSASLLLEMSQCTAFELAFFFQKLISFFVASESWPAKNAKLVIHNVIILFPDY